MGVGQTAILFSSTAFQQLQLPATSTTSNFNYQQLQLPATSTTSNFNYQQLQLPATSTTSIQQLQLPATSTTSNCRNGSNNSLRIVRLITATSRNVLHLGYGKDITVYVLCNVLPYFIAIKHMPILDYSKVKSLKV